MQLSKVSFFFFKLLRLNVHNIVYLRIPRLLLRFIVQYIFIFRQRLFSFARHNYSFLERGIHILIKIQSLDLIKFIVNETAK